MTSLQCREPRYKCVSAIARSHAGEILQGAVRRDDRTRRVLVSLPAPCLMPRAEILPPPGRSLSVLPGSAAKARAAVERLLAALGRPAPEVVVRLTTNIPCGKGCGSST